MNLAKRELRRDRDSELRRDRDSELSRDRDSELSRDRERPPEQNDHERSDMNTIKTGSRSLSRRLRNSLLRDREQWSFGAIRANSLQVGVFILLAFISIITYGWQCGEIGGVKEYTFYPYSWTSGSSYTGVITPAISYTGTLTGTVNPGGVATSVYFEWGSVSGWTVTSLRSVGNGNVDVTVTETVTNLPPGTTYYYRLAIVRGADLTYTENQSFTTPGPPGCTTEIATDVSSLSAALNGIVNPNGLTTTAYFQWGLDSSFGNTTAGQSIGSGTVQVYVAANISGLSPYNTYFFRVVAVNPEDTAYGQTRTFNSGPPSPSATTGAASSITSNSAVLNGVVNPNGGATTAYFQWGTTIAYGNSTISTSVGSGTSPVPVAQTLTGLTSSATYYFRIVAVGSGISYGISGTFTTLAQPPTVITLPATISGLSVTLGGTVNPNGADTTAFGQLGLTTAYEILSSPTQSIGSGIIPVPVSLTYTGFITGLTYYFRIVATNSGGTSYGAAQSFVGP